MNNGANGDDRSLALANEIHRICREHEDRWKLGEGPLIEDCLSQVSVDARFDLLRELVAQEVDLKRTAKDSVDTDEYRRRFPNDLDAIQAAFDLLDSTENTDDGERSLKSTVQHHSEAASQRASTATGNGDSLTTVQHFRIKSKHARGGLGQVSIAIDEDLNREVAFKEIQDQFADDTESQSRFLLEAEITGGLEHPGIVPVYQLGRHENGRPYYTMRFVRGRNLGDAVKQFHEAEQTRRDQGQRSLDLRKLLGHFVRVCNAVEYAHSRGILHRDLKPSNVMLGNYGETLVVDWGLAKSIDLGPRADSSEEILQAKSPHNATAVGSVVGTPAYMSPEQASGSIDSLGPASDIYSLGATLYTVLTGEAPFDPKSTSKEELLAMVRQGKFRNPRDVSSSVPRPLEAICLKAMATDPKERYASATRLAEDIERWLADERPTVYREPLLERAMRLGRKHRGVTSIGVLALLAFLLTFGIARHFVAKEQAALKANAERQRDYALKNLGLADKAAAKYLTGISRDPRLRQHDLEDLRTDLLLEALPIYDAFVKQPWDDPNLEERRGKAIGRVGDIYLYVGSYPRAIEHYGQAVAVLDDLVTKQPEVASYRRSLAVTQKNLGIAYRNNSQNDEAERAYLNARKVSEGLVQRNPEDADARRILAECYGNLGNHYSRLGMLDQAKAAYQRNNAELRFLSDHWPSRDMYKDLLATGLGNYGVFCARTGRLDEAEESFEEALSIRSALSETHDANPDDQRLLGVLLHNFGMLYIASERLDKAIEVYQRAIVIRQGLASSHPTVSMYAEDLALSINNLATVYADTGDIEKSTELAQDAVNTWTRLVSRNPTVATFRDQLSASYNNLALLHRNSNRLRESEQAYFKALELQEELVNEFPRVHRYADGLAFLRINLGDLYQVMHRPQDAEREYHESLRVRTKLVETLDSQVEYRYALVRCQRKIAEFYTEVRRLPEAEQSFQDAVREYNTLKARTSGNRYLPEGARIHTAAGNLYYQQQKWRLAQDAYRKALEIRNQLVEQFPERRGFRDARTGLKHNLGLVSAQMKRVEEAEQLMLEALDEWMELAETHPSLPAYQSSIAQSYNDLAALIEKQKRLDEATQYYRKSVGMLESLAAEHGAAYSMQLGLGYANLAHMVEESGSLDQAIQLYGQAIETLQPLWEASPTGRLRLVKALTGRARCLTKQARHADAARDWSLLVEITPDTHDYRLQRALSRAKAGSYQEAVAEADDLIDDASASGEPYYNAACVLAQAAVSAARDSTVDKPSRNELAVKLRARAVELLTLTHKAGFFADAAMMELVKEDPDLDPLRSEPGFQQLLELLE